MTKFNAAFWRWFGKSKVVDARGRPLVVYHGTRFSWITAFDLSMEGRGLVHPHSLGAIWFASSKENARYFAERLPKKKADPEPSIIFDDKTGGYYAAIDDASQEGNIIFMAGPYPDETTAYQRGREEGGAYNRELRKDTSVLSVFLSLQNPLVLDEVIPRDREFARARAEGRDGIIAKNVVDGDGFGDVYVAFSPTQIKSITNRGTWSRTDPDIRRNPRQPRYLYHGTGADRVPGIREKGLLPSTATHWGGDLGAKSEGKVFAADSMASALYYAGIVFRETLEQDGIAHMPVILRIETSKAQGWSYGEREWFATRRISPKSIYVFWQGSWRPVAAAKYLDADMFYQWSDEEAQYVDSEGEPVGQRPLDALEDVKKLYLG
jgi:hypothetical protein